MEKLREATNEAKVQLNVKKLSATEISGWAKQQTSGNLDAAVPTISNTRKTQSAAKAAMPIPTQSTIETIENWESDSQNPPVYFNLGTDEDPQMIAFSQEMVEKVM